MGESEEETDVEIETVSETKTAALVQKNSEATRALAAQEDHLEKELGEIQKVLLAMQEQQQKQLDLILAIGKNGNLWEDRRGDPSNSPVDKVKQKAPKQVQTLAIKEEGNTDFGLGI
ncbi:hypothetical protein LguiB_032716 [Lonicera macranthoides]